MEHEIKKVGLIPSILLSSFALLYFAQLLSIQTLFLMCAIMFVGVMLSADRNLTIQKKFLLLVVYFIFLASILSFASLFAVDPFYSFIRGFVSVGVYFVLFFIGCHLNIGYISNLNWRQFLSKTLFMTLLVILIGQLLISEWKMGIGGIRLTGGTNPNLVSFFALYVIFISHFNSLLNKQWVRVDKLNWFLALVVLFWSMSRSAILSLGVFYSAYFGWYFAKGYFKTLLNGKVPKKLIKKSLIITIIISIFFFLIKHVRETNFFKLSMLRLTSEEGMSTRTLAWDILLAYFQQNPFFGGVGWWNSTYILPDIEGVAHSSHSLYVRLLSEVGIVGMLAVLALPIFIILCLIVKSYTEKDLTLEKIMVINCSYLIGILVRQFFEDDFLTGIFELGNLIVIWAISLGYILLNYEMNGIVKNNFKFLKNIN